MNTETREHQRTKACDRVMSKEGLNLGKNMELKIETEAEHRPKIQNQT